MSMRWDILIELLKNRPCPEGAEIGVLGGDCSVRLLEGLPRLRRLYCVDSWCAYADYAKTEPAIAKQPLLDSAYETFLTRVEPYRPRVQVLRMFSVDAATMVTDDTLDFVFIDANHSYDYVRQDILAWMPKVKDGGIISGHDYNPRWGVKQAVDELFGASLSTGDDETWWHVKGRQVQGKALRTLVNRLVRRLSMRA